ncbi:uncharacterized protein LOC100371511 [Saccoglossus kowalevskii]|uniref:Uncharacterized protein LOC100371511 n=1 Tax=Saccoglossus kowalevskii TaxID=10224 RepID=A0ABM0GLF5_SACKO|nr:PREDICTED: uncharacterized protein LOC100371511 [Saccoglossus kowalevskii]
MNLLKINFIMNIFAALTLLSVTMAIDTDLALQIYTIFNPMPFAVVFELDTDVAINSMSITVTNNGPDDLPAAGAGNVNYEVKMYIAAVENGYMVDPVEVTGFNLNDDVALRRANGIASDANQLYQMPNVATAVVNYPSEKCSTHSHLCVALEHGSTYVDNNADNDYFCLEFIDGMFSEVAGPTACASDVLISEINITNPASPVYTYDEPTTITFDMQLHNAGGAVVPGGNDNLGLQVFISSDNSSSSEFLLDITFSLNINLSASIEPWGDTIYRGLSVNVSIPAENCDVYTYLCVLFVQGSETATFDDETGNNLMCLTFDEVSENGIGVIECPVEPQNEQSPEKPFDPWIIGGIITAGIVSAFLILVCSLCLASALLKKNKVRDEKEAKGKVTIAELEDI